MHDNEELRRLRKENRELKKRLHTLEKEAKLLPSPEDTGSSYSANNYFSYLFARIREKNFYTAVSKYLKPSLWVTRIFSWGLILYKYIQAGAFVLLYTAAFILIIPILLVTTALTLAAALILRSRNAVRLLEELKKDVAFIIPDGKDGFDREYLIEKCKSYTDATVLLISPFFLDKKGVGDNEKLFVCYRKELDNVYILRNYFFFYFRKRLQKTYRHNVTEVHTFGDKEI